MKIFYYNLAKQWRSLINSKDIVHYFYILTSDETANIFGRAQH